MVVTSNINQREMAGEQELQKRLGVPPWLRNFIQPHLSFGLDEEIGPKMFKVVEGEVNKIIEERSVEKWEGEMRSCILEILKETTSPVSVQDKVKRTLGSNSRVSVLWNKGKIMVKVIAPMPNGWKIHCEVEHEFPWKNPWGK